MYTDIIAISIWWIFFLLLSIVGYPLTYFLFGKFKDGGWGLSKTLSILLISYCVFILSIGKVVAFTQGFLFVALTVFSIINLFIFYKHAKEIITSCQKNVRYIAISEILFALGLLLWSFVRAHQPDINGLEKFMDYGFVNTLLRSDYLPPKDMWAAGLPINYYWYGHFVTALLTKILNIPSYITYNLMLATIVGFALSSVFSVVTTLISHQYPKIGRRVIIIGALISTLFLSFGGNFHTPFYVIQNGIEKYWYPDATRFIGYNPDTNDKTIHEFPLYSYVVADLHGHLLNLPFVLLFIGLLLRAVVTEKNINYKYTLPLGFLLGIMFMTSTWDFGNYNILSGITFGLLALREKKVSLNALIKSITLVLQVFISGIIFALPFILNFESIAEGVAFVNARTPYWQLLILWGVPLLLTMIFLIVTPITKFFKFTKSDVFVLSLLITSLILIILPEIVYVKDIYIASHHRANTMFKLTYQAFVMSYLTIGYMVVRILLSLKNQFIKLVSFFIIVGTLFTLIMYPYFAIGSYYGNIFARDPITGESRYRGLNGETWMLTTHPEEYEVITWFRENITGQPVILEAQGDSYTEFNVISSYTGLPTVNGWYVHEWLWRGSSEFPQLRATDVEQLYISSDLSYTKSLVSKYNVEYVIVGNFERQKYPMLNEQKWSELGEKVFTSGNTNVYKMH